MALLQAASNFLVPAMGATSMWSEKMNLTADPQQIDFSEKEKDGVPFSPYGVWIDNSKGTKEAEIVIQGIAFSIRCPAGESVATPFPAPFNLIVNVTGEGECVLVFVDSPVMPINMAGSGGGGGGQPIPNPLPVTGPVTNAELRSTPLAVDIERTRRVTPIGELVVNDVGVTEVDLITVSFKNVGAGDATVNGLVLQPGDIIGYDAPYGCTLAGINYTATGTSLQITGIK